MRFHRPEALSTSIRMLERLHVIVNVVQDESPLALVEQILSAGQPLVQLRAKSLTDRELLNIASAVVDACHAAGVRCIIDDRIDVALATKADGVHVGEHDFPVAVARELMGPDAIIGGTARSAQAALEHARSGAAYVGFGPVFATSTKVELPEPLGVDALALTADASPIPVIAIAGVTTRSVPHLLAAGCHGVAVVGAVANAPDPALATQELHQAIDSALRQRESL